MGFAAKLSKAVALFMRGNFSAIQAKLAEATGIESLIPPPYSMMIEPTNACNLHCPTCPTGAGTMNRPRRMMTLEEFRRIIDQVKEHVHFLYLWNFGEPFMNKDILEMIRYAVQAGMEVKISTNGEFFKSVDYCKEIVKTGLQHLIIALDGGDNETLRIFRKGSNFDKIIAGFHYMHQAKQELNSKLPRIELQYIVMKHNEHQREHMQKLAKELHVDIFCEKTVGISANDPNFQQMAETYLPTDLSLSRYYKTADGKFHVKGKVPNRCHWLYTSMTINSDGSVVPCCYDRFSEHIMGNVFEDDVLTIWRNNKYQAFRRAIRKNRSKIPLCNACYEGRYHISRKRGVE